MPDFELGTPDGKKYRLSVPEGATPEEIQATANSVIQQLTPQQASQKAAALGVPELREQPSALRETISEGGIASPSNVGSLAGGIVGTAAGLPLVPATGPIGPTVTGMLGAGIGRMLGRGGEVLSRRLLGPGPQAGTVPDVSPPPTAREDIASIGSAGTRGMAEQGAGEIGGRLLTRGLGRVLAPFAERAVANRPVVAEAARLGITDLPASVRTGSQALAQWESLPGRVPIGTELATETREKLMTQAQQAVQDLAGRVSPGGSRDMATVGVAAQHARVGREAFAREASGELFDEVAKRAGDQGFAATNLQAVAGDLAKQIRSMGKFASPAARKGASLADTLANVSEPTIPTSMPGLSLDPKKLPAQLLADMGITEEGERRVTFGTLRDLQSAAGAFAREAKNDREKRYFMQIYDAATADLDALRLSDPRAAELLDLAKATYRRDVVNRFMDLPQGPKGPANEAIQAMRTAQPSEVVGLLTHPGVSQEMVEQAKRAVGPDQWNQVAAAWLHDLATVKSIDPQTGEFSLQRFMTAIAPKTYRRQTLEAILGPVRTRDLEGLRTVFDKIQRSAIGGANPSQSTRAALGAGQLYGIIRFAFEDPLSATGALAGYQLGKGAGKPALGATAGMAAGMAVSQWRDPSRSLMSRGGIVVLSPALLARILFSPGGIRWLSEGLKATPGTQAGIRAATQIASRLVGTATATLNDTVTAPRRTPSAQGGPGSTIAAH